MSDEKIILLTHADPFQQQQLNIGYKTLERSLKNAVLLFGKVTMPGSCILKSDHTFRLVKDAKELLKEGLIAPDLREEYNGYGQYVEKNKSAFANAPDAAERAVFLDSNTKNIIGFPAPAVSSNLEDNLISSLFFLKLNGDLRVSWKDFSDFVAFIKRPGISDRKTIFEKLDKIASPGKLVLSTTQAIYHTLGALVTDSNPIWPQLYSDTFERIRRAQDNSTGKIKHSKEALALSNKYHFIQNVQELNTEHNKTISADSLQELHNLSFITDETLDLLDWSDIVNLSKSKVARVARKKLFKDSELSNFLDLNALIKQERENEKKAAKVEKGLLVTSLVSGTVSCVDDPTIASAGQILSILGVGLTLADMFMKHKASMHLKSYSILGEKIRTTAYNNKTAERLRRI